MSSAEKPPIHPGGRSPFKVAEGSPSELTSHKDDIFFAAIETTRMPMLVTDPRQPDNPIVFANRAFISMTGYTIDELLGRNCRFLQGPATDRATVGAIRDAVARRTEISVEILNYRKDGSTFWNALFVSPVFNRSNELVYYFASQLDVSRRRDAEEGLAQSQKMEALGQLTGGISHDFNNLLQVMSGQLDMLALRASHGRVEPADLERSIARIRSAVGKASTLTQQLLAFSRKQTLRGRVVNLNSLTRGMADLAQRTLGETITVEFDFADDLPNCSLDTTQFEVALLNVMVNARDAMRDGGTIRIETRAVTVQEDDSAGFPSLAPGRYAAISVTDTGTGIAPGILGRVMDPFFTTKEEGKGTGLGLSMVYGFARQSGGNAAIYSELGVGTTLRMYFPATQDELRPCEAPTVRARERGGDESIIVVEDRPEVAELARDMLHNLGYRVHVAASARDALALARQLDGADRPDLLFSDVVMPGGMNGYSLAREMRRSLPNLRVLMTTGFDRDMSGQPNLTQGATEEFDVLRKPYRLTDLARRVRMVLDGPTGTRM